jgi:hypothetical protein
VSDGDTSWDVPGHIMEVVTELHLRDRGFEVGATEDGGAIEVKHPGTGAHSVFVIRTIHGEAQQATWLREVLSGWPELALADAMPDAEEGAVIARVLRERAAHLRTFPPENSDEAVTRIASGFATEGQLSEALRLWIERAIEVDASSEPPLGRTP